MAQDKAESFTPTDSPKAKEVTSAEGPHPAKKRASGETAGDSPAKKRKSPAKKAAVGGDNPEATKDVKTTEGPKKTEEPKTPEESKTPETPMKPGSDGAPKFRGNVVPQTWAEAGEADRMIFNMKRSGELMRNIKAAYEEKTGKPIGGSTLSVRLSRMATNFDAIETNDIPHLVTAIKEYKAEKFTRIAALMEKAGASKKYKPALIQKEATRIEKSVEDGTFVPPTPVDDASPAQADEVEEEEPETPTPMAQKPATLKLATSKPAISKSATSKPAVPESAVPESAVPESAVPKSAVPKSAVPKPAVPKSAMPKPVVMIPAPKSYYVSPYAEVKDKKGQDGDDNPFKAKTD